MNVLDVMKYGNLTFLGPLSALPFARWETGGVCGIWSVKNIVAHIASYEWVMANILRQFTGGGPTPYLDTYRRTGMAFNDEQVDSRKSLSAAADARRIRRGSRCGDGPCPAGQRRAISRRRHLALVWRRVFRGRLHHLRHLRAQAGTHRPGECISRSDRGGVTGPFTVSTQSNQHTNRLIHETSPYLLQHAHNPVDWYAWGDEALQRRPAPRINPCSSPWATAPATGVTSWSTRASRTKRPPP